MLYELSLEDPQPVTLLFVWRKMTLRARHRLLRIVTLHYNVPRVGTLNVDGALTWMLTLIFECWTAYIPGIRVCTCVQCDSSIIVLYSCCSSTKGALGVHNLTAVSSCRWTRLQQVPYFRVFYFFRSTSVYFLFFVSPCFCGVSRFCYLMYSLLHSINS